MGVEYFELECLVGLERKTESTASRGSHLSKLALHEDVVRDGLGLLLENDQESLLPAVNEHLVASVES